MPSLRNSGQNTFFPKQAKLSESFSCTYSFQILCLEFQTPVFGIPNILHSCVFGIPNMHVWNSEHVVFRARFARAQIPNVQSFRDMNRARLTCAKPPLCWHKSFAMWTQLVPTRHMANTMCHAGINSDTWP